MSLDLENVTASLPRRPKAATGEGSKRPGELAAGKSPKRRRSKKASGFAGSTERSKRRRLKKGSKPRSDESVDGGAVGSGGGWKQTLRNFVPWAPMPGADGEKGESARKRARKNRHKKTGPGPAWELPVDEPTEDEAEAEVVAKAAQAKLDRDRRRAAAVNVGSGRSRRLAVRKSASTSAQVCAAYPLGVHSTSMQRGMFLGHDQLGGGGAFIYDPFEALEELVSRGVTNTNMMVLGQPGFGKSALIKTMLERMAAIYGQERLTVICDVKGEYDVLADRMGLTRVVLEPGGSTRVNPLEFVGRASRFQEVTASRHAALMALATMVFPHRDRLTMVERRVLGMVCEKFAERPSVQPVLSDVIDLLDSPSERMTDEAKMGMYELMQTLTDLRLAFIELRGSTFGSLFNGHSTVTMDPDSAGIVIDISKATSEETLGVIWVAATTWLRSLMLNEDGRRKIQVFDESWKMVGHEPLALFLQDSWKLSRTKGGANIAILHRLSDLSSQARDGSVTAKVAQGLISDTAVRVTHRQTVRDLRTSAEVLGYGPGEQARITTLGRGESYWKLGDASAHLNLKLFGHHDAVLCDTEDLARREIEQ